MDAVILGVVIAAFVFVLGMTKVSNWHSNESYYWSDVAFRIPGPGGADGTSPLRGRLWDLGAMTDREELEALLTRWGVGYNGPNAERNLHGDIDPATSVVVCEGDAKIEGWGNFFAVFYFDEAGTFQRIAVWE